MLEASTLQQQQQQQLNGQQEENTPIPTTNDDRPAPPADDANLLLLATGDVRFQSCDQWVHSTIEHQQTANDDDELSSSKQSTNDDDELDSDGKQSSSSLDWIPSLVLGHGTTTDTDNDNDLLQSNSTSRPPTYPVNIVPSERPIEIQSNSSQHLLNTSNQVNNDLAIYSTSVASGASIETLKPSTSPVKQTDLAKAKPSSWADLFRNQAAAAAAAAAVSLPAPTPAPTPPAPVQTASPTKKTSVSSSSLARSLSGTQISAQQQNGNVTPKPNNVNSYSRPTYHVYNSNGGESKTLEGQSTTFVRRVFSFVSPLDYFTKCEVRPSAMAIKPRGLQNKSNYCYVNAVSLREGFELQMNDGIELCSRHCNRCLLVPHFSM